MVQMRSSADCTNAPFPGHVLECASRPAESKHADEIGGDHARVCAPHLSHRLAKDAGGLPHLEEGDEVARRIDGSDASSFLTRREQLEPSGEVEVICSGEGNGGGGAGAAHLRANGPG